MKQISITLDNSLSGTNADVVLFDALKNAAHVLNTINTYQTGAKPCLPLYSLEGMYQMAANTYKDYSVSFNQKGDMFFDLGKFIGSFKISLKSGSSYLQLLEFLKTTDIKISRVNVASNLPLQDENWRVINSYENGQINEELIIGNKVITPQTVNNTIGIFRINKIVSKFTSIVVNIRASEIKTYTVFYS